MTGEFFLIPMLLVIGISYLIVRGAAIALMMTGLDEKRARFQALSAFSGTGFTTREAELIVNHPQRRKIVTWLMILGNAGLVTVIVTATSSLVTSDGYHIGISAVIIVLGIFLVYQLVSRNALVMRWERFIERRLFHWKMVESVATEDLIHFIEGYGVIRVISLEGSPLIGQPLSQVLADAGDATVLGIERDTGWVSLPSIEVPIMENDILAVYGNLHKLKGIFVQDQGRNWKSIRSLKIPVKRSVMGKAKKNKSDKA